MKQETTAKILSIILIIGGILLIVNSSWYSPSYHMQIDFTGIEWPVGGIMVLIGFVLLRTVLKNKSQSHKENNGHQKTGKASKFISAIVAFIIATIVAKIVIIPSIFLVFIQENLKWPNYIQGILFFASLALAIWAGIVSFKAVYARMLKMTKEV